MNTAIHYQEHLNIDIAEPAALAEELRLTEVIIPQSRNSGHIIFPLVASMTAQQSQEKQQHWVTWITDRKPSQQQLKQFGANTDVLRIIHTKKNDDNRWIIWDALNTGNSHTVIADVNSMNKSDIEQMEQAAANGNCSGILIRSL